MYIVQVIWPTTEDLSGYFTWYTVKTEIVDLCNALNPLKQCVCAKKLLTSGVNISSGLYYSNNYRHISPTDSINIEKECHHWHISGSTWDKISVAFVNNATKF